MKKNGALEDELSGLCKTVRQLATTVQYQSGYPLVYEAMKKYPHAPQPHNLLGVLLEKQGDHTTGMKHFRAAWALDPTYLPAQINLEHFGDFFLKGHCAYDETDCPKKEESPYRIEYIPMGVDFSLRG